MKVVFSVWDEFCCLHLSMQECDNFSSDCELIKKYYIDIPDDNSIVNRLIVEKTIKIIEGISYKLN